MDAKITRKRLGEMLAYDWIKILAVIAAVVFAWLLIFQVSGVRLSAGQSFHIHYYGRSLSAIDAQKLSAALKDEYLSYDVLKVDMSNIPANSDANEMLVAKNGIREGDLLVVENVDSGTQENLALDSLFCKMIDGFRMMAMEDLVASAEQYLAKFYDADGQMLDTVVEDHFRTRMKKDNRFRKEKQMILGVVQEKIRLAALKDNLAWLKAELEAERWRTAENKMFVRYAKNTQAAAIKPNAGLKIGEEKTYGLRLDVLQKASEFVRNEEGKCQNMTVVVYDYTYYQPDLQYETIAGLRAICDLYGAE